MFQGDKIVVFFVVWQDGKMKKSDYCFFNICLVIGVDDFVLMVEVVECWYCCWFQEIGEMLDLILIDGGCGQFNVVFQFLLKFGVEEMLIVGLVKCEEEVYMLQDLELLWLLCYDVGFQFLQQVCDEVYWFVVS